MHRKQQHGDRADAVGRLCAVEHRRARARRAAIASASVTSSARAAAANIMRLPSQAVTRRSISLAIVPCAPARVMPCTRNSLARRLDRDGAGRQGDRVGVDHQADVGALARLEAHQGRADRQRRMHDDLAHVPSRLDDLLQQPGPVEQRARAEADRKPLVRRPTSMRRASHTTASAEPAPAEHQERGEEPRQQQPEEVQKDEQADRVEHVVGRIEELAQPLYAGHLRLALTGLLGFSFGRVSRCVRAGPRSRSGQ